MNQVRRSNGHRGNLSPNARVAAVSPPRALRAAVEGAILVGATVLVYLPALRGGYIWDDALYVTDNFTLRSVHGLYRIWFEPTSTPQYYPLVFSSFWFEYRLWGLAPLGYHVVNVALHAANALLVRRLLRRLAVPGSLFAAALFALHPVQVESVAWISERKDVLSGLFALLTALAWLQFIDGRKRTPYALVVVSFACALLSKTVTCTLPVTLLLLGWWKHPGAWRRNVIPLLLLVLMATAAASITVWRESIVTAAMPHLPPLSLGERVLVASRGIGFYLAKLLWPSDLMAIYPKGAIDAGSLRQYGPPLAITATALLLWWFRARVGRGAVVAALSFVVALLPSLGVLPFGYMAYSYVANHFLYLASVSFVGACAVLASRVVRVAPMPARAAAVLAGLILAVVGRLTWNHAGLYESAETLWRANLAGNPTSATVHTNLAFALMGQDKHDEAISHYEAAVSLDPNNVLARNNLAVDLIERGEYAPAFEHLSRALEAAPMSPTALSNLGDLLVRQGRFSEALAYLTNALRFQPDSPVTLNNLGVALIRMDRFAEALPYVDAAARLKPDYAEAHNSRAVILAMQGHKEQAAQEFATALRLKPGYADADRNLRILTGQLQ